MKIRQKRVLAYVLAMVMVLNLCAVPVRAEDGNTSGSSSTAINVTVNMEGWIYGNTVKSPSTTIEDGDGNKITSSYNEVTLTYTYYTDADCKNKTTTDNGAARDGEVPTYAGTYYVKVVVPAKDTYASGEGKSSFEIKKAELNLEMQGWKEGDDLTEFTYPVVKDVSNNQEYSEEITYSYDTKTNGIYTEKYIAISKDDIKKLPAGTYRLKAAINNANYEFASGKDIVEFTVEPKDKKKIAVAISIDDWLYGNTVKSPSTTIEDGDGNKITSSYNEVTLTYTYYTDADCKNKTTTDNGAARDGEVPTYAGTYYVKVVVPEKDTYASGEATAEFTIEKASITPAFQSDWTSEWMQGDTNIKLPELTKGSNPGNSTVTYSVKKQSESDTEYKDLTVSDLQKIEPGEYTIKASVASSMNYSAGETATTLNFTVKVKKDNSSPSNNPLNPSPSPTKNPLVPSTPAPTQQTETPTPTATPIPEITINGKDVKNNQKISVSLGTSITITASSKITIVPKAKKNQKKCLKVSVKNNKGTIKVKSLCKNAIKVIITEKSKKTSTTIWINTKVPTPKFKVKINKSRTKFTIIIKNKSVVKKIGCYTVEARKKAAYQYMATDKFKIQAPAGGKYSKGTYSFRIRFWNTKKPVKKGKLLTKKYMYSEQVQKLKVR